MMRILRSLINNTRGATIIEFALVLPLFILIFCFVIEMSIIGFSMVMIENGMSSALRAAKVGKQDLILSRTELIRKTIKEQSFGLISPERLTLTNYTTSFGTSSNIGPELCYTSGVGYTGEVCPCSGSWEDRDSDGMCDSAQSNLDVGASGEVVLYTAIYRYKTLIPFVDSLFAHNSMHEVLIVSGGAVRNE
jgi:hypothetical protein